MNASRHPSADASGAPVHFSCKVSGIRLKITPMIGNFNCIHQMDC